MIKKLFTIFLLAGTAVLNAQVNWVATNMFSQKNFVENKGQVDKNKLPDKEAVLYTAKIDGVIYYFTRNGFTISHGEKELRSKDELEELKKRETKKPQKIKRKEKEDEEEMELKYKMVEKFHELKWLGANPNVQLIPEHPVTNYYSYSDPKNKTHTIVAHAYTKIIYKNLYPFIDVSVEFPKDTTGIKYSIYLYPGASVNDIRMIFPDDKIKLKKNNDLEIRSEFGNIIDHRPVSRLAENESIIQSNFKIVDNQVGFELENTPPGKTVIIDPWLATTNFGHGTDGAFDVDYDDAGNAYAYGGYQDHFIDAAHPYEIVKYNTAGTLMWTFTPIFPDAVNTFYGDFAVDRNSNTIYIVEGLNNFDGSHVMKIDTNANVLAVSDGFPGFNEMWRIAFSRCTGQAVIGGGGIYTPSFQVSYLDTSLTSLSPVSLFPDSSSFHDVALLAVDNYGNCYEMLSTNTLDSILANQLIKLPIPSLGPVTYDMHANYAFLEAQSVMYNNGNGYNGLTTSGTSLYSYDSYVVKKWDGPSGNLLIYKRVNYPTDGDSSKIHWGGISSDDCGNVFLGDHSYIRQYHSGLTLVNSYAFLHTVTDLALSSNGILYVCGLGFIGTISPGGLTACASSLVVNDSVKQATCNAPGMASVAITGGVPPYHITWNTVPPQYGDTAFNLPEGTYTVTITDSSCTGNSITSTVVVNLLPDPIANFSIFPTGVAVANSVVSFTNLSTGAITASWNFHDPASGADSISSLISPTHIFSKKGIYCVTLIASDNSSCSDTITKCIEIIEPEVEKQPIEIPNVFTPNGDHKNDEFYIKNFLPGTAELFIYDRWGVLTYHSSAYNNDWNGSDAVDGVYYYILKYPTGDKAYTGFVELVNGNK